MSDAPQNRSIFALARERFGAMYMYRYHIISVVAALLACVVGYLILPSYVTLNTLSPSNGPGQTTHMNAFSGLVEPVRHLYDFKPLRTNITTLRLSMIDAQNAFRKSNLSKSCKGAVGIYLNSMMDMTAVIDSDLERLVVRTPVVVYRMEQLGAWVEAGDVGYADAVHDLIADVQHILDIVQPVSARYKSITDLMSVRVALCSDIKPTLTDKTVFGQMWRRLFRRRTDRRLFDSDVKMFNDFMTDQKNWVGKLDDTSAKVDTYLDGLKKLYSLSRDALNLMYDETLKDDVQKLVSELETIFKRIV